MITKLKILSNFLFGNKDNTDSGTYFLRTTFLSASVFLFILVFIHLIMDLKVAPVYFAGISSVMLLILFFLVRFSSCYFMPKLIMTLWGLIFLDLTWHSKFQSMGPVLFFIFAFGILILWLWEGRFLVIMLTIYFLNNRYPLSG